MAKRKTFKKLKLNKLTIILSWIVAIVCVLFLICTVVFKVWVSTWQTYRNDEFGFSFKYPRNWYMGGTDITKEHFEEIGSVFFWVDKEKPEKVQDTTELKRSNGDVVIFFDKKYNSTADFFEDLSKSKDNKLVLLGNRNGYESEGIGGITTTGLWMSTKNISVNLNNYDFGADTLTYTDNNPVSILIGKIEHKIGSTILNSFRFD